jgi:hypothetical protein
MPSPESAKNRRRKKRSPQIDMSKKIPDKQISDKNYKESHTEAG